MDSSNTTGAQDRIVNGQSATKGQFPYIALLDFNHGEWSCTAILISPTYIFTAQHCFRREGTAFITNLDVFAGGVCRIGDAAQGCPESDLQKFSVDYVIMDSTTLGDDWQYDLAIIKLDEPIPISDNLKFVCITEKTRLFDHESVTMAGYGLLALDQTANMDITGRLQYLTLMDQVTAEEIDDNLDTEDNSKFETKRLFGILGNQPMQSGAPGDSGTGILYRKSGSSDSYQLIGLYLGALSSAHNSKIGIAINMEFIVRDLCKVIGLCIQDEELMRNRNLPEPYLHWDNALIRKSDARKKAPFNENSFERIENEVFEKIEKKCLNPMEAPYSHFFGAVVKRETGEVICGLTILTPTHGISAKSCFISNKIILETHDDTQPEVVGQFEVMVGQAEFNGDSQSVWDIKQSQRIPIKKIGWRQHDAHHETADMLVLIEFIEDTGILSGLCITPPEVEDALFLFNSRSIVWENETSIRKHDHYLPDEDDVLDECDLCKKDYLRCIINPDYDGVQTDTISESNYGGAVMDQEKMFYLTGVIVDTKSCPGWLVAYEPSALYNDACFYLGLCPAENHFVLLSLNAMKTIEYN